MSDNFVHVGAASEIREQGRMRVNVEGRNLAIFHHEGQFYAVDNRCPHMGFPLSEGTVENGILTCHWHHVRFDLACGDTFDLWADDVPSHPTEVRDGDLYLAANPRGSRDPVEHWKERLNAWFRENTEVRDADRAERVIRTAIQVDIGEIELARMLFGAPADRCGGADLRGPRRPGSTDREGQWGDLDRAGGIRRRDAPASRPWRSPSGCTGAESFTRQTTEVRRPPHRAHGPGS